MSIEEALPLYLEFLRVEVQLSDDEVEDVRRDIRRFRAWRRFYRDDVDLIDSSTSAEIDRYARVCSEAEADTVECLVDWLAATEQIEPLERAA